MNGIRVTLGFANVHTAAMPTLMRSMRARRLAQQGAERQRAQLESARQISQRLAASLDSSVDEVIVSQPLLPFLWMSGSLGGRRIHVLCTQLPMHLMHAELDRAWGKHPESMTLGDFRAERWLADAEEEAMSSTESIITPHSLVAKCFAGKSVLLQWAQPQSTDAWQQPMAGEAPSVLFPCATLGRKGAYELRETLRDMNVRILLGGRVLEEDKFWNGFDVADSRLSDVSQVDVVVQPCIVESQPRVLLRALAAGAPVITTMNSGLHRDSGATLAPPLDACALRNAIVERIANNREKFVRLQLRASLSI